LNSDGGDSNFAFSPDGKMFVKSASNYPGHRGEGDLYVSLLRDGKWSAFEHLGDVNTAAREFAPSFSPDGKYLYFTSNRGRPRASYSTYAELLRSVRGPQNGLNDIYRVEVSALKAKP
jgi:Tol biopolymer transport system component